MSENEIPADHDPEDEDYRVGYKNPPKDKQFKKGQSGNPNGRPRGSRNFATVVRKATNTPVRVRQDGKPRTVSTQEAALMRLVEKALAGDHRALAKLLELAATYNIDDEADPGERPMKTAHREILDRFLAREAGRTEPDEPAGDAPAPDNRGVDTPAPDAESARDNAQTEEEEDDEEDWLE